MGKQGTNCAIYMSVSGSSEQSCVETFVGHLYTLLLKFPSLT